MILTCIAKLNYQLNSPLIVLKSFGKKQIEKFTFSYCDIIRDLRRNTGWKDVILK